MPSVVEVLRAILGDVLWPVGYTLIGVFIGLFLQEIVKTERKRTQTMFRPLLDETLQVSQHNRLDSLDGLRADSGEYESKVLQFDVHELLQLNQSLSTAILAYNDRIATLERYRQPHVPLAEVFVKVGYDEHFANALPEGMVTYGTQGIDPTNRPSFPGPALLVGTYTTRGGDSDYFESGYKAAVQTDRRYPLFAFLLENFDSLQSAEKPDDIRALCEESEEIDTEYMDAKHAGWDVALWDTLYSPFEPSQSISERLGIQTSSGEAPDPMVTGDDFFSVVRGCEMATRFSRMDAREDVIDTAEEIQNQLIHRLGMSLLNPQRMLLAAKSTSASGTLTDSSINEDHRDE